MMFQLPTKLDLEWQLYVLKCFSPIEYVSALCANEWSTNMEME
jgi:hypothetical protein